MECTASAARVSASTRAWGKTTALSGRTAHSRRSGELSGPNGQCPFKKHCSTNEYKAPNRQSAQWHRRRKPMGTFQPRVAVDRFRLEPKLASFGPISQLTLGSPSSFEGVAEPILSWYGSFRAGAARERSEARMNEPMARLRNNAQLDRSPKATTLLSAQARC